MSNDYPHIWIPGVDDVKEHTKREYGDAQHERKPHGIIFINGQEVATTLQCPHCHAHFISRKGSGAHRTFCMKCMAVTCGKEDCRYCKPYAAELGESQGRMV